MSFDDWIRDLEETVIQGEYGYCFADGADPHEECGRWDNGRLVKHCLNAGTEDCAFCPYTLATPMESP